MHFEASHKEKKTSRTEKPFLRIEANLWSEQNHPDFFDNIRAHVYVSIKHN